MSATEIFSIQTTGEDARWLLQYRGKPLGTLFENLYGMLPQVLVSTIQYAEQSKNHQLVSIFLDLTMETLLRVQKKLELSDIPAGAQTALKHLFLDWLVKQLKEMKPELALLLTLHGLRLDSIKFSDQYPDDQKTEN